MKKHSTLSEISPIFQDSVFLAKTKARTTEVLFSLFKRLFYTYNKRHLANNLLKFTLLEIFLL